MCSRARARTSGQPRKASGVCAMWYSRAVHRPGTRVMARLTAFSIARPFLTLSGAAALAAVSIWLASGLEIRSSFQELLPSDLPSVRLIQELVKRVGGDGTVFVNVESLDGPQGLPACEAFAPKLAQEFLALGPDQIRAVDWNVKRIEAWYEEHWPLFVPLEDLQRARDAIREEIRRRTIEANPLAVQLDDEDPAAAKPPGDDPATDWLDPKKPLPREQVRQRFARYVDGFYVHPNHRSLTIVVRPTEIGRRSGHRLARPEEAAPARASAPALRPLRGRVLRPPQPPQPVQRGAPHRHQPRRGGGAGPARPHAEGGRPARRGAAGGPPARRVRRQLPALRRRVRGDHQDREEHSASGHDARAALDPGLLPGRPLHPFAGARRAHRGRGHLRADQVDHRLPEHPDGVPRSHRAGERHQLRAHLPGAREAVAAARDRAAPQIGR